jgi:hypothetical protein
MVSNVNINERIGHPIKALVALMTMPLLSACPASGGRSAAYTTVLNSMQDLLTEAQIDFDTFVPDRSTVNTVAGEFGSGSKGIGIDSISIANDLPVIGAVFDQRRRTTVKSEFIILSHPVIASAQSEQQLLCERNNRLRDINQSLNPFSN